MYHLILRPLRILLCAAAATGAAGPLRAQQAPSLEDLFRVRALGDVDLSPDGTRVLYTVRSADLAENRSDVDVWLAPAQGGDPVRMTRHTGNDTQPRWSPDGRSFAFLSARRTEGAGEEGRAALYRMSVAGGEPERLVDHPAAIRDFRWSPDGRRIAFTARDEEAQDAKDRKKRGRDVEIEDSPEDYTHLWVVEVENGTPRRLTQGRSWSVRSFDWSPDGQRLVVSATPTPAITDVWRSDLFVVDAQAESAEPRRLTQTPGPEDDPVWSPDGQWLVYQGNAGQGYRIGYGRVFRLPAAGGSPEDVSPRQDLDPSTYHFTPDGRGVFFEAVTGTTRGVFYMPLATRQAVRLTPESGVYADASLSSDGRRIAFTHESPEQPEELHVAPVTLPPRAAALASASRLTSHNAELARLAVGRTEVLRWKGSDGKPVEGVVVYPAGWSPSDGPRALVVKIHGGPAGVYVQNFQAAGHGSNAQLYAADGYVTLLPNPRGSMGYGDEAQRSVINDWGGLDFHDIMTGVDTLIARGVAHPDSLGVMGWSYGGYMTAWTVTQTDRFRAAVVGAGITEPISMWGTQDIIHTFEGYFGGGHPWAEGRWAEYQESSPLASVQEVSTPTLVIHGRNDPRVPPNQGQIFYRALRALGVPTALVWLPRTPHGPSEPGLQYETARLQKAWMDHWVRGRPLPKELSQAVGTNRPS